MVDENSLRLPPVVDKSRALNPVVGEIDVEFRFSAVGVRKSIADNFEYFAVGNRSAFDEFPVFRLGGLALLVMVLLFPALCATRWG